MFKVSAGILFLTVICAATLATHAHAAVIYCTGVGVPQGCVARAGVPAARAPVASAVANRGGPVNRVGVR
jgi:hypothetical protein